MPKSRNRKGRKSYRPKPIGSVYSVPEPLSLFRLIGKGSLEGDEEEAACQLLLQTMGDAEPGVVEFFQAKGFAWPPQTSDDIRALAKLLIESEREETSGAAS